MAKAKSEDQDKVVEGRKVFESVQEAEAENRQIALESLRFTLLEEQWPDEILKQREIEGRPALTINKLKAFGRQVINDARQNKPAMKVHPVDSGADPETAEIINGLLRHIEYVSNADVAYDTGCENAVWGGFGYWRIKTEYAYDDSFEMDLVIKRVANPFSVYGDPDSTEADSCDWNRAFITDWLTKEDFEREYGEREKVHWDDHSWDRDARGWKDGDSVQVAEWWSRKKIDKPIVLLSDGRVVARDDLEQDENLMALVGSGAVGVVQERVTQSYEVTQRIMSGLEILRETVWPGKYIPIVPVYGDEFYIEGKRHLRSLVHSAMDSQRMFNYWRTVEAEIAGYTPRVPWVGPVGSFATDPNWANAHTQSHPYLEYDVVPGGQPPQRQPLDVGVAAGAMHEAMSASDDIKAVIGMYDASLGARSNETSGRAIMARQREGDVATFHFVDNTVRAIRHTGRILIDLIPKVYTGKRIVRIIGEDGSQRSAALGEPVPVTDRNGRPQKDAQGNAIMRVFDLAAGKYDLTVTAGPNFTTRRQEAAAEMTELIRAFPAAAPVVGDLLAKNLDWPGADEIAERLKRLVPGGDEGLPPEIEQIIEAGKQRIAELEAQVQQLEQEKHAKLKEIETDAVVKERVAEIDAQTEIVVANIKAEAQRQIEEMKAVAKARTEMARPQSYAA